MPPKTINELTAASALAVADEIEVQKAGETSSKRSTLSLLIALLNTVLGWTRSGTSVVLTTITDRVGIGTATPAVPFHVFGTSRLDGDIALQKGSSPMIYTNDANALRLGFNVNERFRVESEGASFGGGGSYGGGVGLIFVTNAAGVPTTNPAGGFLVYGEAGAGKGRGSSGTVTTFVPAEPHCPVCGSDFGPEYENPRWGRLVVCMRCLSEWVTAQSGGVRPPWIQWEP